ncbi:hypothetical protein [Chitinophaga sp.]|uniref:hypothetical protein n=1 Tax=Chitinophaga sp. TaxID=1869181 RepID=UPI0031E22A1C
MKKLILFVVLAGGFFSCRAQTKIDTVKQFEIVELPGYYKEKGIIFNEEYLVGIDMKDKKYRFTPTVEDIKNVEEIFIKQYNQVQQTNIDTKDFFCHWVRQYVGFIDNNGKKNIILQLINNKRPGKINRLLGRGWETNFVVMLSDDFYAVSTCYRVNIDTGEMTTSL